MNVEHLFFWLRLVARAILEVLDRVDEPGEDEKSIEDPGEGFKPERIQFWLGVVARATLETLDDDLATPGSAKFKPERIQFWLTLFARFVLAIFAAVNEETGKSGESASTSQEVDW